MTILPFNIFSSLWNLDHPNPNHSLISSFDSSLIQEQGEKRRQISLRSVFIAPITGNSITPEARR
jgi:hypothetical protein